MARDGATKIAGMERAAVSLSFWLGGVSLSVLKGVAYVATGSVLVRTSMFDSVGDVFSSAILAITQRQISNSADAHLYPVGKSRFGPLGIVFFCAFMLSSMISMAIDSFQALLSQDPPDLIEGGASRAVRQLLEDQSRIRRAYGGFLSGRSVDELVARYGEAPSAAEGSDNQSSNLLAICVLIKLVLYLYCRAVAKRHNSDIVRTLAVDHLNDTMTNAVVIGTVLAVSFMKAMGFNSSVLQKLDPAMSLLMSCWIIYGWLASAREQLQVLTDQRVSDSDICRDKVMQTVTEALRGEPLEIHSLDAYHAGTGVRIRLDLRPIASKSCAAGDVQESLAAAIARARVAASQAGNASCEVLDVETRIFEQISV